MIDYGGYDLFHAPNSSLGFRDDNFKYDVNK